MFAMGILFEEIMCWEGGLRREIFW